MKIRQALLTTAIMVTLAALGSALGLCGAQLAARLFLA